MMDPRTAALTEKLDLPAQEASYISSGRMVMGALCALLESSAADREKVERIRWNTRKKCRSVKAVDICVNFLYNRKWLKN